MHGGEYTRWRQGENGHSRWLCVVEETSQHTLPQSHFTCTSCLSEVDMKWEWPRKVTLCGGGDNSTYVFKSDIACAKWECECIRRLSRGGHEVLDIWWLIEVPYWWKRACFMTILGIFPREMKDIISTQDEIEPTRGEIETNIGKLGWDPVRGRVTTLTSLQSEIFRSLISIIFPIFLKPSIS